MMSTGLLLFSCGRSDKKPQSPPPPVSVTVHQVEAEEITTSDPYPGVVTAINEVEIRAQVGGQVTAVYIRDGQRVSKGDKLYEIDRTKYLATVNSAQAGLRVAKSNYNKAKKDAERYTTLADKEAVAKQRVDYAITDLENAAAEVSSAQAELANAQADLNRSVITSPLSGTIGISLVKVGTLVTAGSTVMNTVSLNDPIAVDIAVNQQDLQRFAKLKSTNSNLGDSLFSIQDSKGSIFRTGGKVLAIDRAVDPGTGTVKVRLSFSNKDGLLVPGMLTTLNVREKSDKKQLTIPYKAVSEQLGEQTVYIVADSSKAAQRIIKLGRVSGEKVVVNEGLKIGDQVISEGLQNVRPGAVVKPQAAGQKVPKL